MRFRGGVHSYYGRRNSRGQRTLSKIHKGMQCGDLEKAFKLVDNLKRGCQNVHK